MSFSFGAETRDSLSNLAASLGAGKDKAAGDAFFVYDLSRAQVDAMYRGDWLARKVVDIVPYDMVREWRAWSAHAADVARAEAAERRLGLRKAVQRALVLGRLYGGGAIIIGTGERDPAALACPLEEDWLRPGGLKFLHVVSRWQLGAAALNSHPLSPWCGEPALYELAAAGRAPLMLHPSRVVRFLGNPLPDPWATASPWSDSVLQALYDAVHAAALTVAGATSLMHEAKVDVVTVPNLSEHLSSAETTEQLSARFAYAAAMKSINNLLLLGDGETWSRQSVDLGGLPEMVRCFLQVAAGAADIPVTRLLGQSPSGLSATGESDTRNYYDMIAARQELDLRPQLERLDRLMLRSEGLDPAALTFAFRPLWQLDAASAAAIALQKAQATQVYAGLKLWPAAVTARLVEAQLVGDGTYPNAAAVFAEGGATSDAPTFDFNPDQPRDPDGQWTTGTGPERAQPTLPSSVPSLVAQSLGPIGLPSAETSAEAGQQTRSKPTDPTEPDPVAEAVIRYAAVIAAPVLVMSWLRQRAAEIVRGLANHLPDWLGGLPPDPPPSAAPAGSGARAPTPYAEPLPRPLTIHGGSPQIGPDGQQYSLSQRAGGPAGAGSPRKPVWALQLPNGTAIPVKSGSPTEEGNAYEASVRQTLNFDPAPVDNTLGGKMPDGIISVPNSNIEIALEVKYLSSNERPLRDPGRGVKFIFAQDLDQARKYVNKYEGGLLWVTNDANLAKKYDDFFKEENLSGIRIFVIPSIQE